jgi:hypothetical protein
MRTLQLMIAINIQTNFTNNFMGRNNERNIKKHNDKLHKAQDKVKQAEMLRKEKLKQIVKKFNENND